MTDGPSLFLIRHADAEPSRDDSGRLTAAGRGAAERLSQRLAKYPIAAVYSSPFPRARETIAPLAQRLDLPIHDVADLRERDLGTELFADFTAAVRATWDDFDFRHPGGESNAEAQRRVVAAATTLIARHPDAPVLLSTHGNALALLLRHYEPTIGFAFWAALSRPDAYRLRLPLHGAGGAVIERLWLG